MFELASPWILLTLPLPFLIWLILPRSKKTHQSPLKVPFFETITTLQMRAHPKHTQKFLYFLMIFFLTVIAAAGPRWVGLPLPLPQEGHNIMLVLDISGSMDIQDRVQYGKPTTRLQLVKLAAENFVKHRGHSQIGLILFGTRAYLQTPLTHDHKSVLMRLNDATVGLAGKTTSLGDALGLAVKHMQHTPKKGRVVILLTDGANNSGMTQPLKAAQLAAAENIKVYTIGLSNNANLPLFGSFSGGFDDLDEETLKAIAKLTQGQYFRATDKHSLEQIYHAIDQLETVKQENMQLRPEKNNYPKPLALAFFGLTFMLAYTAFRGKRR